MYIYEHDSIYIQDKGDTVFKEKYVYRYKDVYKIDSIMIRDTVFTQIVTEVPKEKELSKTQKAALTSGWILWVLLLIVIIYLIYKLFKR